MFGSVHEGMALEFVRWLQKVRFDGHIYFDTFPRNEVRHPPSLAPQWDPHPHPQPVHSGVVIRWPTDPTRLGPPQDPVREAEYNIRRVKALWKRAATLTAAGVDELAKHHDAMGALELMERVQTEATSKMA